MDNYEKILDKQELRYVLGTAVSGKATYLKKTLTKVEYEFVTDITKARNKKEKLLCQKIL